MLNFKILLPLLFFPILNMAQNLPLEVNLTQDGRLTYGGNATEGFYSLEDVHKLEITLMEANWFQLMDGSGGPNGNPGESLIGTLRFNDTLVLDSVLVSIKGQTSDFQNNSEKKSFKIEIDEFLDQALLGYDNLNLNCAFQDHSSMREVLYYDISKFFTPSLKASFVDLYINGQYWGPYNNIQQIEGRYIKEWFTDNDGTRWRALRTAGTTGGPGGPNFGAGRSTLNYNGPDSTDYNTDYTLKKSNKDNPWEDLIEACEDLNNLPISELYDELKYTLDIDRALWFLVQEIIFADDDSYIHKGGMDYYVYWDHATDRIIPMEVDGNSVLRDDHIIWSPFYNEEDPDFPLLNRLLQNTEVRQRYLAHLRTALERHFTEQEVHERIDEFAQILDQRVQDDPKKIYTYNQFLNGVEELKNLVSDRIEILSNHNEVDREGLTISNLLMQTSAGVGMAPQPNEEVQIRVEVNADAQKLMLYYGLGLDGVFERTEMFDDGMHGDLLANDNIYGAVIPGLLPGKYVRYYVEAIKDDAFGTASYYPEGAEHDVFIYQVEPPISSSGEVVINEFMADNINSIMDNAAEYDDWIELYNKSDATIDLSEYFLSDDGSESTKWQFPSNSLIAPDAYMIIWADDDQDQSQLNALHANFKLSSSGESIVLSNPLGEIIDQITYAAQEEDISFARRPNGTGNFQSSNATFNANNDNTTEVLDLEKSKSLSIYPNPASQFIFLDLNKKDDSRYNLMLLNATGQQIFNQKDFDMDEAIDIRDITNGIYHLTLHELNENVFFHQKLVILR